MKQWYYYVNDQVAGPASEDQLKKLIATRAVLPDTLICEDNPNEQKWIKASDAKFTSGKIPKRSRFCTFDAQQKFHFIFACLLIFMLALLNYNLSGINSNLSAIESGLDWTQRQLSGIESRLSSIDSSMPDIDLSEIEYWLEKIRDAIHLIP